MLLLGPRAPERALSRLALFGDAVVGGEPVIALVAPIELVEIAPGRLAIIDVAKPRPGEPDARATGADLDEAHEGQEAWEVRRTDVAPLGHAPTRRLVDPVVVELTMLRDDQLRPERCVRRSRHVGAAPRIDLGTV